MALNQEFMQRAPQQGNGYQPEQNPSPANWQLAGPQPGVSPAQNRPSGPAPRPEIDYPGNGLKNTPGPLSLYQQASMPPAMILSPPQQPAPMSMPAQYPGVAGPYQQPQPMFPTPGPTTAPGQQAWYQPGMPPLMPMPVQPQVGVRPGPGFKPRQSKRSRFPVWARVALGVMALLLAGTGGVAGYYYVNLSAPMSGIVNQQVPRLKGDDDPNQGRGTGGSILGGGRINILLLGSDTDEKFQGTYLAQTDIVVTIDPATKQVAMLSIPRDFWINVPGSGMHKLD